MALSRIKHYLRLVDKPVTFHLFRNGDWKNQLSLDLCYEITNLEHYYIQGSQIYTMKYRFFEVVENDYAIYTIFDEHYQYIEDVLLGLFSSLDDAGWNMAYVAQEVHTLVYDCSRILIHAQAKRGKYSSSLKEFIINNK